MKENRKANAILPIVLQGAYNLHARVESYRGKEKNNIDFDKLTQIAKLIEKASVIMGDLEDDLVLECVEPLEFAATIRQAYNDHWSGKR